VLIRGRVLKRGPFLFSRKKKDRHVSLGDSLACISPFFASFF
jgi:hypothetical protein